MPLRLGDPIGPNIGRREFTLLGLATGLAGTSARADPATPAPGSTWTVRDFGARGDGVAKDTRAIQQAIDRCAMLGGGIVRVPPGRYATGALEIGANVRLSIDPGAMLLGSADLADYPIRQVRWEGRFVAGHVGLLSARNADGIAVVGGGRIVGNPAITGRLDAKTGLRNPALMEFVGCRNVEVDNIQAVQNDMWAIHPLFCEDVRFTNLTVQGGADGIDIDSCERVQVRNCRFDTGDDCIAIKSGRGMEGYRLARPTADVEITDCVFHDSRWACIGIGSETSGGIRGIRIDRCRFLGAKTHAIYIKSRPGRGAFIEDIRMRDLDVSGVEQGFLRLNFLDSGKRDEVPVPGMEGFPKVSNISIERVRVNDAPVLVEAISIPAGHPVRGFSLSHVSGTCREGMRLANIADARLKDIAVSGYTGPLLSTRNVSGSGLEGAVPLPA
jgi:polygalacturonase